ncbi:MAG: hypothetical protein AVDCRST_MAG01-01-2110, partial [uncultured Rubrobacteraceae bacterium]
VAVLDRYARFWLGPSRPATRDVRGVRPPPESGAQDRRSALPESTQGI